MPRPLPGAAKVGLLHGTVPAPPCGHLLCRGAAASASSGKHGDFLQPENGMLQLVHLGVKRWIIPPVFYDTTCVGSSGAVTAEQVSGFRQVQAVDNMGEVHCHLPCKSCRCATPGTCSQLCAGNAQSSHNRNFDHLLCPNRIAGRLI